MCGLVWAAAHNAERTVPEALKRLHYRGYDSFGFACLLDVGIETRRSLEDLREFDEVLPSSAMVLGHTRWATHGEVSLPNCHPHMDSRDRFALAHNGIVENTATLEKGIVSFETSDSALIAKLLASRLDDGESPQKAFLSVVQKLEGRNAVVAMFQNGDVFGYRQGSPLLLVKLSDGIGLASDALAFGEEVEACYPLEESGWFCYSEDELHVYDSDLESPTIQALNWQPVPVHTRELLSGDLQPGAGTYMRHEILEQWRTMARPIPDEVGEAALQNLIRKRRRIIVTGAGGAGIVAQQVAHLIQSRAEYQALAVPAPEIQRYQSFMDDAVLLAVSQSGETADTLCAIEFARRFDVPVVSLVNMPFCSMSRCSDLTFQLGIGPEHCVLSTKSATAQLSFGYWLAGLLKNQQTAFKREVSAVGQLLADQLDEAVFAQFQPVVEHLATQPSLLLLGRSDDFATAQLAALNLKEASYIHAEAFSAGELKHGVIALVEPCTPALLFGLETDAYMKGVASELKSRGAVIISVGSELGDFALPEFGRGHPISAPITGQILAYLLARHRGVDPDRPRNLAKSVTVL